VRSEKGLYLVLEELHSPIAIALRQEAVHRTVEESRRREGLREQHIEGRSGSEGMHEEVSLNLRLILKATKLFLS
jgi:hypothetical protein